MFKLFSSLMSLKCSLFYAHFQCRIMANNSEFIELRSLWLITVKTIDFLGGSMGEMIGRGMPNVFIYFIYLYFYFITLAIAEEEEI